MRNPFANPNIIAPVPDIPSSLAGRTGRGSEREKRRSIAEYLNRLQRILSILPEDSKRRLSNQIELIRQNPEAAIEALRKELEASRAIIDMLDDAVLSTDEALAELDKFFPKERIH